MNRIENVNKVLTYIMSHMAIGLSVRHQRVYLVGVEETRTHGSPPFAILRKSCTGIYVVSQEDGIKLPLSTYKKACWMNYILVSSIAAATSYFMPTFGTILYSEQDVKMIFF